MKKIVIFTILVFAFLWFNNILISDSEKVYCQENPEKNRVQIGSDHLSGDDNTKVFHLWGNVNIKQEDAVLYSDDAIFDANTNIAVATNNVKFTRPGTTITGNKVTIYYDEKRGVWEGNVHIVQEKTDKMGNSAQKQLQESPVNLYCDNLEFFWEKPREAIATGNVKVDQKDKHASGDKARYTEKPQTIIMESNVKLEKDDGSWLTCDKLTIHIKEETAEAEGNVKGNFMVKKEEE